MRTLSTFLEIARHLVSQDKAFLWFCEIPRKAENGGGYFRLVRASKHVEANEVTWQACGFQVQTSEENADGDLGSMSITVPNVSLLPMRYLEVDGEFLGQMVTVWIAHESQLSEFNDDLSWRGRCLSATANEEGLQLQCGHPLTGQMVPGVVFDRRTFPQMVSGRNGVI